MLEYELLLHESESFCFAMLQHVLNVKVLIEFPQLENRLIETGNEFFVQLKCRQRAKKQQSYIIQL
jgi:hypothetical protein